MVRSPRVWIAALLIVIASAGSRPVFAQPPPPNKPTAAQDQFVPVDRPMNQQDTLPAPRMLAAAYAFVWVVLLVYLWSIRRRLASVEKEIATVNRRLTPGGRSA
ncbi:MAG TPA: CcmD family protein [Vicinamibacterales bacterium]|jgi:CcmD family protein